MKTKPKQITKYRAVRAYGSQSALARALGITRQAVSAMETGPLSERWQLKLRYELKPDVFGPDVYYDEIGPSS